MYTLLYAVGSARMQVDTSGQAGYICVVIIGGEIYTLSPVEGGANVRYNLHKAMALLKIEDNFLWSPKFCCNKPVCTGHGWIMIVRGGTSLEFDTVTGKSLWGVVHSPAVIHVPYVFCGFNSFWKTTPKTVPSANMDKGIYQVA